MKRLEKFFCCYSLESGIAMMAIMGLIASLILILVSFILAEPFYLFIGVSHFSISFVLLVGVRKGQPSLLKIWVITQLVLLSIYSVWMTILAISIIVTPNQTARLLTSYPWLARGMRPQLILEQRAILGFSYLITTPCLCLIYLYYIKVVHSHYLNLMDEKKQDVNDETGENTKIKPLSKHVATRRDTFK